MYSFKKKLKEAYAPNLLGRKLNYTNPCSQYFMRYNTTHHPVKNATN
jgi:hypothetical protein